ncbi:MAG: hypothetical protein KGL39_58410 [Patescibacteria group bacterium]|nr:hypothetical protein [Patescibacteria group bacterium]
MKWSGIEFYSSNDELHKRPLDEQLAKAANIDAVVIIGRTLAESDLKHVRRVQRVIMPSPKSESAKHYAQSVNEASRLSKDIADATVTFEAIGTKVRWYPHMICQTFLIGDASLQNGWVHVEMVPPYSAGNLRPSWTAYRKHHERLVASYGTIFEKMWAASEAPDKQFVKDHNGEVRRNV